MTIEDFLAYVGIEAKTIDEAKSKFDGKYILKEKAPDEAVLYGRLTKNTAHEIKKAAKAYGLTIEGADAEKPIAELINIAFERQSGQFNATIEDLKKKAGEPSEALKLAEEKLAKAQQRADDEARAKSELAIKLESEVKARADFEKRFTLKQAKDQLFKGLPFSDTANDLVKRGFNSMIGEKYVIDLDDTGATYIADATTKSRIPDPAKHGAFLSPEAVLKTELENAKLAKVSDSSRQGNNGQQQQQQRQQESEHSHSGVRTPHARAVKV